MPKKKILISGVKPTVRPHIGNYFGAMKQFADLQNEYEARIFIADYHTLATMQKAAELSKNRLDVAIDYLAIDIDSAKDVVSHDLMRAHAYKDAQANFYQNLDQNLQDLVGRDLLKMV